MLLKCNVYVGGKRPSATQDNSPVWVPDSQSPKCMHCRTTEFTLVNRRVRIVGNTL